MLKHFIVIAILYGFMQSAYASMPLWRFIPLTATTVAVESGGTATIQYTITNQSPKEHVLTMRPIAGIRQITSGFDVCPNPFTLGGKQSCTLTLEIDGNSLQNNITSGPVVCQVSSGNTPNPNACYQPNPANQLNVSRTSSPGSTTLTVSVSALALSVNCPVPDASCTYSNSALIGTPRTITVTNIGSSNASNVTYDTTAFPAGTSISPVSCGTLTPGTSCTLTITPGKIASTSPGLVDIAGTNTNTVSTTINVLTYGSNYQSGYVFSVDDTTNPNMSIDGKVLSLSDQSSFIPWDPGCPGACIGSIAANSDLDGLINTTNIYNAMSSVYAANAYAAGLCYHVLIDGYTDWYMPAICEMGYDNSPSSCGDASNPTLQNIQSNLVDNNIVPLNASYWSSTQTHTINPDELANLNNFGLPGNQPGDLKESVYAVRCVRKLS